MFGVLMSVNAVSRFEVHEMAAMIRLKISYFQILEDKSSDDGIGAACSTHKR
jgi:hypothetical protein